ncbi:ribbon-helix-helix domain-containing protein [Albimonas donghaensis]|uniref:ribbon-helix-helix domain-containing protein n=1 Tax=Albimonas donghaensis TaxID=356660 RepID=UPI000B810577|nr:ribbon-helix-helix domain-containing protein [Albimonas donghaensis]
MAAAAAAGDRAQTHPDYAPPEKRSLTLRGHRSSVTLEPDFWMAFRGLAAARGLAINALAVEIDEARPPDVGLATAIRLYVLENVRSA